MKTHPFESITEEQWKSGLSRRRCALCACDYDDPVHGISNWPLIILDIGGHEPRRVEDVMARVRELDQQGLNDIDVLDLLTGFMIIVARDEVGRN